MRRRDAASFDVRAKAREHGGPGGADVRAEDDRDRSVEPKEPLARERHRQADRRRAGTDHRGEQRREGNEHDRLRSECDHHFLHQLVVADRRHPVLQQLHRQEQQPEAEDGLTERARRAPEGHEQRAEEHDQQRVVEDVEYFNGWRQGDVVGWI